MSYSLKGEMLTGTVHGKQTLEGQGFPRGNDGISPTVEVTENENGHRVEITDVYGTKAFDVRHGKDGDPGYTPQKGIDYFDGYTPVKGVDYNDGKDGYTPRKGVDYFDGKDGYTPVKGKDYFDGKDGVDGDDYVLTEADLAEIAVQASKLIDIPEGGGDVVYVTVTDGKSSHTREQIQELAASGKAVLLKGDFYSDCTYYLQDATAGKFISIQGGGETCSLYYATVSSEGDVEEWKNFFAMDAVRYYATQNIPEEFRARARNNIGAAADDDVVKTVNGQAPDASGNVEVAGGGSGIEVTAKPGQLIRVKEVDENGNPTAWEAVPWGYTEDGMVEILPETAFASADHPTFGLMWMYYKALDLKVGESYTVTYNGTPYECVCQTAPSGLVNDPNAVAMGNFSVVGGTNTGEPFALLFSPENIEIAVLDLTGSTSTPTIGIHGKSEIPHPIPGELLPEGVPYCVSGGMVEIYPESQIAYGEDMGYVLSYDAQLIEVGKTYIINWNGVEYTCVGQDASSIGPGMVFAGNGALAGFSGNDEPFVIGCVEGITFAEAIDGSTEEITVSIKGEEVKIQKLDPRCLPNGVGGAELHTVYFTVDADKNVTTESDYAEAFAKASDPNCVVRAFITYADMAGNYIAPLHSWVVDGEVSVMYFAHTMNTTSSGVKGTTILWASSGGAMCV